MSIAKSTGFTPTTPVTTSANARRLSALAFTRDSINSQRRCYETKTSMAHGDVLFRAVGVFLGWTGRTGPAADETRLRSAGGESRGRIADPGSASLGPRGGLWRAGCRPGEHQTSVHHAHRPSQERGDPRFHLRRQGILGGER